MTGFAEDPPHHSAEEVVPYATAHNPHEQLSAAQTLLPTALSAAVPWWIVEIAERGGPTAHEWTRLQGFGRLLAERGDQLLFRSSRTSETAEVFNALAEALAILAFLPGGVPFGDQHFDAHEILSCLLGEERAKQMMERARPRTEE